MAQYLEAMTEECQCDEDCDCKYSEAKDNFYYPKGWHELVDNCYDWSFIPVSDGTVTHWSNLPEPPE